MTADAPLAPKLRFPEFRDAGEWDEREVGEVFDVTRGKVLAMPLVKDERTDDALYPVYSSQTKNVGLVGYFSEYLYEDAITWTTDGANAGDVNYRSGKFYCTNVCGVLISDKGFANRCTASLINGVSRQHVSYIGNPKLMNGVMAKIRVPFPSLFEQQRIAACLGSLDDVIATQGRKLEALRHHKQGLMQQLFPRPGETAPAIRFPEFRDAGAWREQKLDSLAKRGSGHTPNKSKPEYYDGGIKWVSLADSAKLDNGLIFEAAVEISEEGLKNSSAKLHPAGSVILSRDAGIGKSAILNTPMAVSQHFICWTCDPKKLSNWFLYYKLQIMKPLFEDIATGSTIKTIGLLFFKTMRLTLPQPAEQQRIADCLGSLDGLIAAQGRKLDTLKQHKQGLMQRLFPSPVSHGRRFDIHEPQRPRHASAAGTGKQAVLREDPPRVHQTASLQPRPVPE